jgi:hypothetical protein
MPPPGSSPGARAITTRCRSIPGPRARSIRSMPRRADHDDRARTRRAADRHRPHRRGRHRALDHRRHRPAARAARARVHILVKPTRPDIRTNLVINTDRRTYHIELHRQRRDLDARRRLGLSAHRPRPPASPPPRPVIPPRPNGNYRYGLAGRQPALAAGLGLRRWPPGLCRLPARHRPGRDAAALRPRPRWRARSSTAASMATS